MIEKMMIDFIENDDKKNLKELRQTLKDLRKEKEFYRKDAVYWEMEAKENEELLNKLESWLEKEKTRLAIEVSTMYKDELDRYRFVNEDIFNELDIVLAKIKKLRRTNEQKTKKSIK